MKLALFVHELTYEIGHSKAFIEYIRNIDGQKIEHLTLVVQHHSPLNELFPHLQGKIQVIKIEGHHLRPALLKNIYFHMASKKVARTLSPDTLKMGIGTASLDVDLTNIQFIHHQWEPHYFQSARLNPLSKLYKQILFAYEKHCERTLFSKKGMKFFVISEFLKDYLIKTFHINPKQISVAYSNANPDIFRPVEKAKTDLLLDLQQKYPILNQIKNDRPIILFVGAFQRKGLPRLLKELQAHAEQFDLIAVGKSEKGQSLSIPPGIRYFEVSFTKELPLFYSLADAFVFPTIYEPYGLVIVEAALMGLPLFVTEKEVGATEVLKGLSDVHIINERIPFEKIELLSRERREKNRSQRLSALQSTSWSIASSKLVALIEQDISV